MKYAANAFLATKITFMNEIANFRQRVGADVDKARIGIGTTAASASASSSPASATAAAASPRMFRHWPRAGNHAGYEFQIIKAVMEVNEDQKTSIIPKIKSHFG